MFLRHSSSFFLKNWVKVGRLSYNCNRSYVEDIVNSGRKKLDSEDVKIIEEDEDYFFVFKPSNVSLESKQEFHQLIQQYGKIKYDFEPRVIFPLEKASSGICVFAKSYTAEKHFFNVFSNGCVFSISVYYFEDKFNIRIRSKDTFVMKYYAAVSLINSKKLDDNPNGTVTGGLLTTKKSGNKYV